MYMYIAAMEGNDDVRRVKVHCTCTLIANCLYVLPSPHSLQFSGGMDWRKKLDSQRGAVLATELKNNSCKIAKWALCSYLAGSSFIKFG